MFNVDFYYNYYIFIKCENCIKIIGLLVTDFYEKRHSLKPTQIKDQIKQF